MNSLNQLAANRSSRERGLAMRCRRLVLAVFAVLLLVLSSGIATHHAAVAGADEPLSFRVSFNQAARSSPADGRVYVIIDKNDAKDEPRLSVKQILSVPFWGQGCGGHAAGTSNLVGR